MERISFDFLDVFLCLKAAVLITSWKIGFGNSVYVHKILCKALNNGNILQRSTSSVFLIWNTKSLIHLNEQYICEKSSINISCLWNQLCDKRASCIIASYAHVDFEMFSFPEFLELKLSVHCTEIDEVCVFLFWRKCTNICFILIQRYHCEWYC